MPVASGSDRPLPMAGEGIAGGATPMRILFLTQVLPYPLDAGPKVFT